MRFVTNVAGITCQCERIYSTTKEFDCALYDMDGHVDIGLMMKVTEEDSARLFDEYTAAEMAQRNYIEYCL